MSSLSSNNHIDDVLTISSCLEGGCSQQLRPCVSVTCVKVLALFSGLLPCSNNLSCLKTTSTHVKMVPNTYQAILQQHETRHALSTNQWRLSRSSRSSFSLERRETANVAIIPCRDCPRRDFPVGRRGIMTGGSRLMTVTQCVLCGSAVPACSAGTSVTHVRSASATECDGMRTGCT